MIVEPVPLLEEGVPWKRLDSIGERMAARARDGFDRVTREAAGIGSRGAGVWRWIRFAATALLVLVLLGLVADLVRWQVGGIPAAHDLQTLRDYMLLLVELVVTFMVLGLLVAIVAWLFGGEPAVVSPFTNATPNDRMTAISDLLVGHLDRIAKVQRVCIVDIPGERLRTNPIRPKPETVDTSLANIGSINLGQATISIGQILITLKRLLPIRSRGTTISGSVQRYGRTVQLVATIQRRQGMDTIMVSGDSARDDGVIVTLVPELAYRIHHVLAGRRMEAGSWELLRCFTEARAAYIRYLQGSQPADLEQAVELTWRAHAMDCAYGRLFGLFYGLGTCFFRTRDYHQAKRLFHRALAIEPQNQQATIQLAKCHYTLGEDEHTLRLLREAVGQPRSHPTARYMLGLAYGTFGQPQLAVAELLEVSHQPRSLRSAAWVTIAALCLASGDRAGQRSALGHVAERDFHGDAYSRTCWLSAKEDGPRAVEAVREALCKRLMPPEYMRRDPDLHWVRHQRDVGELIELACHPNGATRIDS